MKKNLTPFKEGQSGNPKGNALDRHSTKPIRKQAAELLEQGIDTLEGLQNYKGSLSKSVKQVLVEEIIKKAIDNQDVAAFRAIMDAVEGDKGNVNVMNNMQINLEIPLFDDTAKE